MSLEYEPSSLLKAGAEPHMQDDQVPPLFAAKPYVLYRGTSLIRNSASLRPYGRTMPMALGGA